MLYSIRSLLIISNFISDGPKTMFVYRTWEDCWVLVENSRCKYFSHILSCGFASILSQVPPLLSLHHCQWESPSFSHLLLDLVSPGITRHRHRSYARQLVLALRCALMLRQHIFKDLKIFFFFFVAQMWLYVFVYVCVCMGC